MQKMLFGGFRRPFHFALLPSHFTSMSHSFHIAFSIRNGVSHCGRIRRNAKRHFISHFAISFRIVCHFVRHPCESPLVRSTRHQWLPWRLEPSRWDLRPHEVFEPYAGHGRWGGLMGQATRPGLLRRSSACLLRPPRPLAGQRHSPITESVRCGSRDA